jgi:hypothetical protein
MALVNAAATSGSVTDHHGASGLLETLLAFVLGTDVTGATTTGSGAGAYTATLTTPVGLGRTTINYAFSSVNYTATDDGSGTIAGTNISSASINHSTGAFTVTFTSAPDANPTVDYLHGEPGQDWQLKFKRDARDGGNPSYTEPFGSLCKECIIHNTGLSGAENVLIGFREWYYVASPAYGWDITGYLSYTADQRWQTSLEDMGTTTYDGTWEHWSDTPMLPLLDDTMYYWFYSNQQRICGAVKCSSKYETFYAGFGNRYGNPEDYPYPLIITASAYGNVNINTNIGSTHSFILWSDDGGVRKLRNILPDNSWSQNWGSGASGFTSWIYPYTYWTDTGTLNETPGMKTVLLSPAIIHHLGSVATIMEFDGVYHVAGVGVQSEDIIRANDLKKYRVFQNVSETDYYNFMCIAEDTYTTTTTTVTSTTSTTHTT